MRTSSKPLSDATRRYRSRLEPHGSVHGSVDRSDRHPTRARPGSSWTDVDLPGQTEASTDSEVVRTVEDPERFEDHLPRSLLDHA
ncbi:MAG: hypothetical protein ACRD6W_15230, partial [Nitrososphaerales archaeon]